MKSFEILHIQIHSFYFHINNITICSFYRNLNVTEKYVIIKTFILNVTFDIYFTKNNLKNEFEMI